MTSSMWRPAIVVLGLLLLWRVIEVNAVLYESTGRPKLPAPVEAAMPGAIPEREELVGLLRENPAQAAAYLMLAREFERGNDDDRAARAYAAAYQVAPVDRDVLAASADFFVRHGRVPEALMLLSTALEHYEDLRESAFPLMADSLASGRESSTWNTITAHQPSWLGPFVVASCIRGVDPGILVPVFLARVAASKATRAETACLVDRLRTAGRWDEAYQVWLDSLPRDRLADVGFIFNGGFEYAPSGVGFDWIPDSQLERDSGHTVEFARTNAAEGHRALRIAYSGKRQTGIAIAQYLALAPGRYEVSGVARPESIRAGHGAQWTLRCVQDGKAREPLARSERFLGSSDWTPFAFEAAIPEGCRGQLLQLEAVGADGGPLFLAGTLWFDNMAVRQYH